MAKGGSKIKLGGLIAGTTVVTAALVTGLVFATAALFTDEGTVSGRITAGDMQIGLYQTSTQSSYLDDEGYITVGEKDEKEVDLLNSEDDYPLFDMDGAIPGVWTEKTIRVDGTQSDVAFSCALSVTSLTGSGSESSMTEADKVLAENIKITITYGEEGATTESFMLLDYQDGVEVERPEVNLGNCTAKGSLTFIIKAEFDGTSDVSAEEIRDASITFDINVRATQIETSE